ncbi:MAG: DUF3783 domain-containing protein [Selenomonadaceae bacterium]
MKKMKEKVLLYQFEEDRRVAVEKVMRSIQIETVTLPPESWRQKIGYLLGIKGFKSIDGDENETFDFPHEVMLLYHIQGKQLDRVLKAMRDAELAPVRYKAVVTPYNVLWTLRKQCETMQKEHAYMAERDDKENNENKEEREQN